MTETLISVTATNDQQRHPWDLLMDRVKFIQEHIDVLATVVPEDSPRGRFLAEKIVPVQVNIFIRLDALSERHQQDEHVTEREWSGLFELLTKYENAGSDLIQQLSRRTVEWTLFSAAYQEFTHVSSIMETIRIHYNPKPKETTN